MKYVATLKQEVSRFGMGCMRYPQTKAADGGDIIDENEAVRMIRHAVEKGVNFFDTAYAYGGSEEVLGKALAGGLREKVLIQTKCPMERVQSPLSYYGILEESLKRLKTNYVDVYLFHGIDRIGWEKVKSTNGFAFMENMKKEGTIRNIGFSFHGEYELFEEIVDAYPWDTCMIQLNILDQNHQAGVKGLKYAASKGIDVNIMEPLKGGNMINSQPEEVRKLLSGYPEQRTLAEWAFRWLYNFEDVKVVLSGVSSMAQLEDGIRIFSESDTHVMGEADFQLINQIKAVYESKVKVGCTGCGYCMPCPEGVNIPEIFKVYNDSALSPWTEFGKVFYSLVATNSGKDVSHCIGCKKCERHCPQHLNIVERLREAHEVMKQ